MPFFDRQALAAQGASIRGSLNQSNLFRGNNRIALLAGGAALLIAGVAFVVTRGKTDEAPPAAARAPILNGLPGNANTNEFQRRLLAEAEARAAQEAEQARKSFAASIAGRTPDPAQPAPAAQPSAPPQTPQAPTITYTPNVLQNPAGSAPRAGNQAPRDPQEDKEAQNAYRAMMLAMIGGWAPKAAAYGQELTPDAIAKRQDERQAAHAQQVASRQAVAPASSPASHGGGSGSTPQGAVVMPALRWSMARTVTATDSSAGGGLVIVDMVGGPLRGARLHGTAQKSGGDRMGVSLNRMSWRGRTVPVNAVLVSPETKETKVASEVNHHYAARLLFPALAAAVSAAGQAVALGGSTVSSGLLGATSTLRRLDAGQIAAVAAGGAANDLRQILAEMAPREATVSLHADEMVGVMFLEDVTDPG